MTDDRDDSDEDVDVFERPSTENIVESDQRWIALPDSNMLSLESADELLRWRSASVVAIVGERNGGKTTLVSEIYERFLRGAFADALFCHSLSLAGFEMKGFQSRVESGGERPDTPRTSAQDGLRFFHLAAVAQSESERRVDLLISERAGETYREIRDNPARATEMVELCKANVIAIIIDGERVFDSRKRAEVFASARHIIRALDEAETIRPGTKIQLVTTKMDLLTGENAHEALEALSEFESRIIRTFGETHLVSVYRTAARDPKGVIDPAIGLAPLLQSWLSPSQCLPMDDIDTPELVSEFDRLLQRRTMQ